ncbi:hypothetical protein GQ53DRAFT_643333, partial [Thozetella sp. PMI_491]
IEFDTKFTGDTNEGERQPEGRHQLGGRFIDKINSIASGGRKEEGNNDTSDKECILGSGDHSKKTVAEQFKDKQISDYICGRCKQTTGSDIPIKDKER